MIIFEGVTKFYKNSDSPSIENIDLEIKRRVCFDCWSIRVLAERHLQTSFYCRKKAYKRKNTFGGKDVHRLQRQNSLQVTVVYRNCFQDFRLLPNKTAYENISLLWNLQARPTKKSLKTCRMF